MVWCWSDLWQAIADDRTDGPAPALLSQAATRGVLVEAMGRARADGVLDDFSTHLEWPGFYRRLKGRIAAWTRGERSLDAPPPTGSTESDRLQSANWAVFVRYRQLLRTLDAEDEAGFAVWSARALQHGLRGRLTRSMPWTFLDVEDDIPAVRRAVAFAHERAGGASVRVTLAYENIDDLTDVYSPHAPIRAWLLELGFVEREAGLAGERPAGLAAVGISIVS